MLDDLGTDERRLAVVRSRAFDAARECLDGIKAREVVGWLEDLVKLLTAKANAGSAPSNSRAYFSPGNDCIRAIREFVEQGGTLVTFDRSSDYAIELFALPLENVARGDGKDGFSCPGSILSTRPVAGSPWTAGLPSTQPIFFSRSRAYRQTKTAEAKNPATVTSLLEFPEQTLLLSGWVRKPEQIAGASAWLRVQLGKGQLHLFSFRPQYRSWSHSTFKLLLRAILLPAAQD